MAQPPQQSSPCLTTARALLLVLEKHVQIDRELGRDAAAHELQVIVDEARLKIESREWYLRQWVQEWMERVKTSKKKQKGV